MECRQCCKPIQAPVEDGGKTVKCPQCNCTNTLPGIIECNVRSDGHRAGGITQFAFYLSVPFVILMGMLSFGALVFDSVICLVLTTGVGLGWLGCMGYFWWSITSAFSKKRDEVPLFFGLAKYVRWEPTTGIVILRQMRVHYVDQDTEDGGGATLIFSLLAEEVAVRLPLTKRTVALSHEFTTRDYIRYSVDTTIQWEIFDIERLYLSISADSSGSNAASPSANHDPARHVRPEGVRQRTQMDAVEDWMRMMAEAGGRRAFAHASSGLLVAGSLGQQLQSNPALWAQVGAASQGTMATAPPIPSQLASAADDLDKWLLGEVGSEMLEYGIDVTKVLVRKSDPPPEIMQAALAAASLFFAPTAAEREARAKQIVMQMERGEFGQETFNTRAIIESLSKLNHVPYMTFVDFLNEFLKGIKGRMS